MTRKNLGLIVVLTSMFALLVAACGSDPTPTPRPTSTPTPTPTLAPGVPTPTPDPFVAEWEALKAAAAAEGELIAFFCCAFGGSIGPFIEEAETALGIKIVSSTGSSRQQWEKVKAEREAGVYSLDVWTGGLRTSNTRLLPGGALGNLKSLLIHPEVVDESLWFQDSHFWGDNALTSELVFAYGGSASLAEISYNTDLVKPSDVPSYQDLLDPKWKGKIIARDPRIAGTSQGVALFYMLMGPEWLKSLLTEMDMVITDDARQAADRLANGDFALCLFSCGTEVENAREAGLPVNEEWPNVMEEGSRVSTGGNTLMAVKDPPNPNAQKLFVNWFLSKDGQGWWQKITGDQSLRDDIGVGAVEITNRREAGKDYILMERDPAFQVLLEEAVNYAIEVMK